LTIEYEDICRCDSYDEHAALVDFLRALPLCQNVISVNLIKTEFWFGDDGMESLDEAIAYCLGCCKRLEELTFGSSSYDEDLPATEFPKIVEALTKNYTIKQLDLGDIDEKQQAILDTFLLLNRAGRGYIEVNAADKNMVIQVLERVNNNLDCLFIHLCENPRVCW
jgi:hypothetical protein